MKFDVLEVWIDMLTSKLGPKEGQNRTVGTGGPI